MEKDEFRKKLHEAGQVLGKEGGKKGGPARAKALSPRERSSIASQGGKEKQRIRKRAKR